MGAGYSEIEVLPTFFNYGNAFTCVLDDASYYEGTKCSGIISFDCTKEMPPVIVCVTIQGSEYVYWTKDVGDSENRQTEHIQDKNLV